MLDMMLTSSTQYLPFCKNIWLTNKYFQIYITVFQATTKGQLNIIFIFLVIRLFKLNAIRQTTFDECSLAYCYYKDKCTKMILPKSRYIMKPEIIDMFTCYRTISRSYIISVCFSRNYI